MKKLIVALNHSTAEEQNKVTEWIQSVGLGFWHRFNDLWLLTDLSDQISPESVRDKLQELLPGKHTLVINVEGTGHWAGYGIQEDFEWLSDARSGWQQMVYPPLPVPAPMPSFPQMPLPPAPPSFPVWPPSPLPPPQNELGLPPFNPASYGIKPPSKG